MCLGSVIKMLPTVKFAEYKVLNEDSLQTSFPLRLGRQTAQT